MISRLLSLFLSLASARVGTASTFYASEPTNNGYAQCLHRPLRDSDRGVALPVAYPCGTRVFLYSPRTGRSVVAAKIDVGPRHQMVDLTKRTTRDLGANGMELVWMAVAP